MSGNFLLTAWASPDARSLIIGVAGGLVVLGIVAGWRIVRAAGFAGLLHLRRTRARSDLKLVEELSGGALAWLARLMIVNIAIFYLTLFVVGLALVIWAALPVLKIELAPAARGFLGGMFGCILTGVAAAGLEMAHLATAAVVDREGLLARLRSAANN